MALSCLQAQRLRAASPAPEYEIKAAFLLNFTRFVEWPPAAFAAPDSPFTLCIAGDDPFGPVIDQLVEGESVYGHKIVVDRVQTPPVQTPPVQTPKTRSCQLLYMASSKQPSAPPGAAGPGVLTVGEGADFTAQGGIIAFVVENRHVRFDVNLKAAGNSGLKLSSKLLSVARSVER